MVGVKYDVCFLFVYWFSHTAFLVCLNYVGRFCIKSFTCYVQKAGYMKYQGRTVIFEFFCS